MAQGGGHEHLTELNQLRAENAELRRQNAELRRRLAASGQESERLQSERRQWRMQAAHALTMDDPEYIRDALEKLA